MYLAPDLNIEVRRKSIVVADWIEFTLLAGNQQTMSTADASAMLTDLVPDDASESERHLPDSISTTQGSWQPKDDLIDSAFAELSWRHSKLQDRYPLQLSYDIAEKQPNQDGACLDRYLSLLRARQVYQNALGDNGETAAFLFEELAKYTLAKYLDVSEPNAVRFGVAQGSRGDDLPSALDNARRMLADRMNELPGNLPASGAGDGKADAIAWKPFADQNPGQIVLLGQATITEDDWLEKEPVTRWYNREQLDAQLIRFLARPVTCVLFAETLSLTDRSTLKGLAGSFNSIPLDRLRIMHLLTDADLPESLLEAFEAWSDTMVARLPQ